MYTDTEHRRSMHLPLHPIADIQSTTRDLIEELRGEVDGEVRFDVGSRALYATDASAYRQVPIGVVVPRTVADVVATMSACERHGVPVLARGGGTSLAGQCCNVAVVIDTSKYLRQVHHIDARRRLAVVDPGVVLDDLRHQAQEQAGLTFGPDPSTHRYCTLGGMIGNDSCGVHAQMAGRTSANVEAMEVLTYDGLRLRVGPTSDEEIERHVRKGGRIGEIYWRLRDLRDRHGDLIRRSLPRLPRRVSGYANIDALLPENGFNVARALVGTEGTCVTILQATVKLMPFKRHSALLLLGYPDIFHAADHVVEINAHEPIGLEALDHRLADFMSMRHLHPDYLKLLPEGRGWLMVQFWGDSVDEAESQARRLMRALKHEPDAPSMRLHTDVETMGHLWAVREAGLGVTARVPGHKDAWPGWEDAAVPPENLGAYLREFSDLLDRYGHRPSLYGHFGQGCVHCRIDFDYASREGILSYRHFVEHAADLVVKYGGSLSGEHGDGQSRAELLGKMYGPEMMQVFRDFKNIWEPRGLMNPGKVIDPYRNDENLRFGSDYKTKSPKTKFRYGGDDRGSFLRAAERCVGVGKCRKPEAGTMCPSYMATHEEKHSTRGRAHLLFEMLQGDVIEDGWKSEAVKESLDLCLACKACKHECPMQVDMATYKAEFLSHHYAGRLRPREAYAFGLVYWWARLASRVPRLVNFAAHAPGLSSLAKLAAGVSGERSIPAFARRPFTRDFRPRRRPGPGARQRRVILWPDTFTNHFQPEIAEAATEVLEAAGFDVEIPPRPLCCGRPLYDYGMLDLARRQLRQILDTLQTPIELGVPIVGLEPSCVSVFRDELPAILPDDPRGVLLSRHVFTLAEFLDTHAGDWQAPALQRKAKVQGHCHHKSVLGFGADEKLYRRIGLEAEVLDSGCCGMAGAFGYEKDKYDVSIACGERSLLPSVRAAGADTVLVADGFSCREQIAQTTPRRALHTAQVLQMALREGAEGARERPVERRYAVDRRAHARRAVRLSLLGAAAVGAAWVGARRVMMA